MAYFVLPHRANIRFKVSFSNVLPEAINQGMWYFSSQIADSEYRLSEALDDFGYAKVLLQEYIEAIRQEATAATIFERK